MKCPLCNTEMFIGHAKYVEKNGEFYRRLPYVCRNKNCTNNGKVVETIDRKLDVVHEG